MAHAYYENRFRAFETGRRSERAKALSALNRFSMPLFNVGIPATNIASGTSSVGEAVGESAGGLAGWRAADKLVNKLPKKLKMLMLFQ